MNLCRSVWRHDWGSPGIFVALPDCSNMVRVWRCWSMMIYPRQNPESDRAMGRSLSLNFWVSDFKAVEALSQSSQNAVHKLPCTCLHYNLSSRSDYRDMFVGDADIKNV
jgi:hypothetical protein